MSSEVATKNIEVYLSDMTDYLLAMGVSPKAALAHAEEVADVVMSSGVDPADEYGPADEYAAAVAEALDAKARRPVLRALAAGCSIYLLLESFNGFLFEQARTIDPATSQPYAHVWTPLGSAIAGLLFFVAALSLFSPAAIRVVGSRVTRLPRPVGVLLVLLLAIVALAAVPVSFTARFLVDVPGRGVMLPFWSAVVVAGLALGWFSGLVQLFFAVVQAGFQPVSNLSYNMFSTRKVRIR